MPTFTMPFLIDNVTEMDIWTLPTVLLFYNPVWGKRTGSVKRVR